MLKARAFCFVCAGLLCLALAPPSWARAEGGYVYVTQWGTYGSGDGQFDFPVGVATNAAGDIYVVDQGNRRVQKFALSKPTPANASSWGSVKSRYRQGAAATPQDR